MTKKTNTLMIVLLIISILLPASASARPLQLPVNPVTFTILHHNDFHGQLQASGSNPGIARLAYVVNDIRATEGADNVLLVDAGDEMQGSLLSNLWQGEPVIEVYNNLGYDVATLGNHEFDWGQTVLISRTAEALYPYVVANLVVDETGDCDTAGWTQPSFVDAPYVVETIGTAPDEVTVGFIGVTSQETPYITIAEATEGLCFKDPAESILHYYDELDALADVIIVVSHIGFNDGGYGYGFDVYGDQTLAQMLIDAGKPVPLIIGGHSHTDVPLPPPVVGGVTTVVQARYNGRQLGRADITVDPSGTVTVAWDKLAIDTAGPEDTDIKDIVDSYANDPDYLALINQEIAYVQTDLLRNYNGDSMMADFVDDAIYNQLNSDADPVNDVDVFFNNPGGIRIDWCDKEDPPGSGTYVWSSDAVDCEPGIWAHEPMTITYGQMFQILPFGNATIVGEMTGAQILELLNQSATLFKGALQTSGMRYSFFRYSDALPGPQPWAWGAFDECIVNKSTEVCEPLDLNKTYKVGTNEFLAPAGQDGFVPFKYLTNTSYWGDMLDSVNAWLSANHNTPATAYKGPEGDGELDGRITRLGDDTYDTDPIIPVTFLHHSDSHGNLVQGSRVGYTQLATLINQERLHNPDRTILTNAGDSIQGDSMMYYFKSAGLGYAADGTALPPDMWINPLIKAFNTMDYDAMTLGNHEFNFGHEIFTSSLKLANFPVIQANIMDDGQYGLDEVPVLPYVEKTVGPESVRVAILGIGNHRVPNYELPSNIPGLDFTNPISTTQELSDQLRGNNDVVLALTHIGFTENPNSVEVDENVDTNLAATVSGLDLILGGHSHTDPSKGFGDYLYLPTIIGGPGNTPVIINHSNRYNNTLNEVIIGLRPKSTEASGYDVVSRAGRYILVEEATPEDPEILAIAYPYTMTLKAYNEMDIGETTVPIDALDAYTEETNGANLQADASVWELEENNGIPVDFHLSGAMSNRKVADAATPASPVMLTVGDMFTLMPYENSLVVMEMNGPQIKAILERSYRNYFYYKHVPDAGGYSYYTTCMLDTNAGNVITYRDTYPMLPGGNNVLSLEINGQPIDFTDADTYYRVSTVNYLAAGACNFSDSGVSLWPLNQIKNDTQFYVRDAVINYITEMGTISPAIEGRLLFEEVPFTNVVYMPTVFKNYTNMANVRVAHASPDAPAVDVLVNDGAAFTNLAFSEVTDYANLLAGTYNVKVVPTGATTPVVIEADLPLTAGVDYTVAAVNNLASIEAVVFVDDNSAPAAGKAHVRFIHLSPDAPAVDVAVTSGPVLFSDVAFKEASSYLPVDAGTYDLEVRLTGTTTVALAVPGVTLEAGRVYTVFAQGLAAGTPALQAVLTVDN